MSGQITITPGYSFENEPVTLDKLNQLGRPVARVAEAAIGSRELNILELQSVVGTSFNNLNFLVAGNFEEPSWLSGAGPITCPAASKTFTNSSFQAEPTGGAVSASRVTTVPNTASLHALRIDGDAGVTTVDILQEIARFISAGLRRSVTYSAWIFNGTGAELVPVLRLNTANSANVFSAVTNRSASSLQACANGVWTKVSVTIDATDFSDMTNGLQIVLRLPSGSMNSSGKHVVISQAKFELGLAATPLSPTPGTVLGLDVVRTENILNLAVNNTKLADNAVSNAKLADMATTTIKGRRSAGAGDPEDMTALQAWDVMGVALADIASAATVNIGAGASRYLRVTGTTTITAFDSVDAGRDRVLVFAGILTLTQNATSLILPSGANITTAAGDVARLISEGAGNWRCVSYMRSSGAAVVGGLDINGLTTEAAVDADADFIPFFDVSAAVNRKTLIQDLLRSLAVLGSINTNQTIDLASRALSHLVTATLTGPVIFTLSNPREGQMVTLRATASGGARNFSFINNTDYLVQNDEYAPATGESIPSGESWIYTCLYLEGKWNVNRGKRYA